MGTAADIIRGAFKILGTLAAEETPSASEESDALTTLNDMIDSWNNERLALWATLRSTHTLTSGLNPHTIGASGTFNTTRPVRIDRASITPAGSAGTETPLALLSDAEWQETQNKTASGTPAALWVESAYPLMKLHLNPVPGAADTLVLYTWQQIGRLVATSTTFDMPPGYTRAIKFNLAKELAPEYGVALSADAVAVADESKAALKRLNQRPSHPRCDPAVLGGGGGSAFDMNGDGGSDFYGGLF